MLHGLPHHINAPLGALIEAKIRLVAPQSLLAKELTLILAWALRNKCGDAFAYDSARYNELTLAELFQLPAGQWMTL